MIRPIICSFFRSLEDRSLTERIFNINKNEQAINGIVDIEHKEISNKEPIQIIYTKDEILRLENEVKSIKKPRGWHFKEQYVDIEGNVYHKGKLQPQLKKIT